MNKPINERKDRTIKKRNKQNFPAAASDGTQTEQIGWLGRHKEQE
ncbi:MAG: hypothetical protein ABRQ39_00385 [Candidatus Eremiobacterota bacterium]